MHRCIDPAHEDTHTHTHTYIHTHLCTVLISPCYDLTQLQVEIDNATQLVKSSGEGNRIDVDACNKARQQLETKLGLVTAADLAEDSPVGAVAEQLISNLKVQAFVSHASARIYDMNIFCICVH